MGESKTVDEWRSHVETVLQSKVDEFLMMGYSTASKDEIWQCLCKQVWKGNPNKRLYEIVRDIFHLRSHTYMTYLTMNVLQDDDLASSIAAVTAEEESPTT